jgi:hypothetical protein
MHAKGKRRERWDLRRHTHPYLGSFKPDELITTNVSATLNAVDPSAMLSWGVT